MSTLFPIFTLYYKGVVQYQYRKSRLRCATASAGARLHLTQCLTHKVILCAKYQ